MPIFFRLAMVTVSHLDLIVDPRLSEDEKHARVLRSSGGLVGALLLFTIALVGVFIVSLLPYAISQGQWDPSRLDLSPGRPLGTIVAYLLGGLL
ncbi:MAG: hypothetical protein WA952_13575, partial [Lewinella sp.]